jgi:hypothetical protein
MDVSCPNEAVVPFEPSTVFVWEDDKPDVDRTAVVQDYNGASITLRKPDGVKVRTAYTDRDGSYRIDALDPGVPYAVSVTLTGYQGDEDRIVPAAGQRLRLDLDLTRPRPNCPT